MPMKRSGRSVAVASRVIEIDEVFVAIRPSRFNVGQRSLRILIFSSSFSVAASMTRSQLASLPLSVVPAMRASVASRSAAVILSFLTRRSRLEPTVASPRSTAASEISTIVTDSPAAAQICAMPLPMVPAPIMPIDSIIALPSPSVARSANVLPAASPRRPGPSGPMLNRTSSLSVEPCGGMREPQSAGRCDDVDDKFQN